MEKNLLLNNELFSKIDILTTPLYSEEQILPRFRLWLFKKNVWRTICESNTPVINVVNIPARCGKTYWAQQIVSNGFLKKVNILTIHLGKRATESFQKNINSTNQITQLFAQNINSINKLDFDVLIVDDVNKKELIPIYKKLLEKNVFCILFITNFKKEDYQGLPTRVFTKFY